MILLVGYGNPLRTDDGVGQVVVRKFERDGRYANIKTIICHQLLPEHAEREVHFVLPSPSWSGALLPRAHRYLQGALIALPFYDGAETAGSEHFRSAYESRYGKPPQTFAAYGYDAYRMISATLRQGHQTREALMDALKAGASVTPVTSVGALSEERVPANPPSVYRVVGDLLQPAE